MNKTGCDEIPITGIMLEVWIFTLVTAMAVLTTLFLVARAKLKRWRRGADLEQSSLRLITERVRPVGRLIGLEVCAKEIATATAGVSWLPPMLLSQARIAMIFHFEKQYGVDLSLVGPEDVSELGDGAIELTLPPIEGTLRLIDVTPYDIQDGRVFGLVDVVPMNAARQSSLMQQAQEQAARLFRAADARYADQARRSVERQLESILALGGTRLVIRWLGSEEAARSESDSAFEPAAEGQRASKMQVA